jgi:tRNA(Ile)-lysidine synthase TilS/MesJ
MHLENPLSMASSPLPIAKPPWTALGKELESSCRKALYDFSMLDGAEKVAVALSGGKDSLALLFLLHAVRGRGFPPFDLIAINVGGEFSCGAGIDERFLRSICRELDVPLVERVSNKKREELECYSCSRERRNLIFDAAKEHGATTIAFGHHRDDSAQTLLLNLLHKAEFAANLPKLHMHHYGVTIIRPLIYIGEDDLRSFAKQYGFLRISCQCPVGQDSKRKQADRLIDQLQEVFPNARKNLARAGLLYGSDKASMPS